MSLPPTPEQTNPAPHQTVYACIDTANHASNVVSAAAWAAQRLEAPWHLLHALAQPEPLPPVGDYSGVSGLGVQDMLQERLHTLDEERGHIAQQAAQQMLRQLQAQPHPPGLPQPEIALHCGDLTDVLLELEPSARLLVLGRRPRVARRPMGRWRLDHNVESAVRHLRQPVLVVPETGFAAPTAFVLAYDGSTTADNAVRAVARSPLLRGLPGTLLLAGSAAPDAGATGSGALENAQTQLQAAGFAIQPVSVPGEADEAIPAAVQTLNQVQGPVLLVLGAYGHTRIRQLIVGSTTTTLLRQCEVPMLVLR